MPIRYKVNVLEALKDKGYSQYRLRKDNLLGQETIQRLREDKPVSWNNIDTICKLLGCDVGDILTCASDNEG